MNGQFDAAVVGGGPAGLMAAAEMAQAGLRVLVAEAKPSVGRKLLMAGKSGLNLTMDQPVGPFLDNYGPARSELAAMIGGFGPPEVCDWAERLGQTLFTGSTGRVFPAVMKASPLLRAWMAELRGLGVELRTRWRWVGWRGGDLLFDTPDGTQTIGAGATVLAMGGASWPRLGSDGGWAGILARHGVGLTGFAPANAGIRVNWSAHMASLTGQPVKAVMFVAGPLRSRGEAVITERGLEGGGIYAVCRAVREGAPLTIDLLPDRSAAQIATRLEASSTGRQSITNRLRKALRLGRPAMALLQEFARPLPRDSGALAAVIKSLPVTHAGLGPLDTAISTAGGVRFADLDDSLMLRSLPGVFCAGEMLDWEAPTGGYLLTACLATGRHAGRAAAVHAARPDQAGAASSLTT